MKIKNSPAGLIDPSGQSGPAKEADPQPKINSKPKQHGMWKRKPLKKKDEGAPPGVLAKPTGGGPKTAVAPGNQRKKKTRKPNLGPLDPGKGWLLPTGLVTPLAPSTNSEVRDMAKEPKAKNPSPEAAGNTKPLSKPTKGAPKTGGFPKGPTKTDAAAAVQTNGPKIKPKSAKTGAAQPQGVPKNKPMKGTSPAGKTGGQQDRRGNGGRRRVEPDGAPLDMPRSPRSRDCSTGPKAAGRDAGVKGPEKGAGIKGPISKGAKPMRGPVKK